MNRLFLFVLFFALLLIVMKSQTENFANDSSTIVLTVSSFVFIILAVGGFYYIKNLRNIVHFGF